jgi:hypothetical protein
LELLGSQTLDLVDPGQARAVAFAGWFDGSAQEESFTEIEFAD